jgi:mycothiol synthase
MSFVIAPCRTDDLATLKALARHPSLADEFEPLQSDPGFDDLMGDPRLPPELRWIASADGMPAGFCFAFLAPTHGGAFAMIRLGVVEHHRRRGAGEALLAACTGALAGYRRSHGLNELNLSAWSPNSAGESFARRHGYVHARNFWRMERPRRAIVAPHWPPGITMRTFDRSEAALADFHDVYNRSFADHYHFVRSSLGDARVIVSQSHFEPEGLALVYRGGTCVAFCRTALFGGSGEVALVGVAPEARGMGIGRALLRWAVAWLDARGADPLHLMVDGENENALELYRSEGFEVARTRRHWSRRYPD